MAEKFMSMRNLKFLLYEVFDAVSLTRHPYYEEYDRKMLDMVLQAARELAEGILWPHFQEMDREAPVLEGDTVRVHPSVKKLMSAFGDGGWISMTVPEDLDGQQLPQMIADTCQFIFCRANYSGAVYPGLCDGAARLIENFGDKALYDAYVPRLRSGLWQGTMALTEPNAGSSLSDITTEAVPTGEGYYRIKGQKIFISAGDHDGVENVVHLMLAKISGAPAGVKGISLFVVPKKRMAADGSLESNDVGTSGIFHKLGYRGCPIAQLSIGDRDDCRGYLVGEPHRGLMYMFQMMNEARIGVGMGAAAMATAAYYAALDYAGMRTQGRPVGEKDPSREPVCIIEHADVKRMLLFQRAVCEGSLALLLQCSRYVDERKVGNAEKRDKFGMLLDLLTPVAKTYPSEAGLSAISLGLQCFGGSGYCDDYPLEQYYRDARIHPIHEGTTGIHGIDLLGRKISMKQGKAFELYLAEVEKTMGKANAFPALSPLAVSLGEMFQGLREVTEHLARVQAAHGAARGLCDATLYLEAFGILTVAWQWLKQAIAAETALSGNLKAGEKDFYEGKRHTCRFFFAYEVPKCRGLFHRLKNTDGITVDMPPEWFSD